MQVERPVSLSSARAAAYPLPTPQLLMCTAVYYLLLPDTGLTCGMRALFAVASLFVCLCSVVCNKGCPFPSNSFLALITSLQQLYALHIYKVTIGGVS